MSDQPQGRAVYSGPHNPSPQIKTMPWPGMTLTASRIADHIHAETKANEGAPPEKYEVSPSVWARLTNEMKPLMNPGHIVICGVMVVKADG